MKFVKNIAIVVCASSFMFAGIGFHMANNYGDMDTGTTTATSWGVTYDLNDNTSVGWDEVMGMLMMFDVPFGVSLRLGWTAGVADACTDDAGDPVAQDTAATCAADAATNVWTVGNATSTSVGLGYTWWTGGEGLNTSISTNYDYIMAPGNDTDFEIVGDTNYSNLSVSVGFGF